MVMVGRMARVLLIGLVLPGLTVGVATGASLLVAFADLRGWTWPVVVVGALSTLALGGLSLYGVFTMFQREPADADDVAGLAWVCGFALVIGVLAAALIGAPSWVVLSRVETVQCTVLDVSRGADVRVQDDLVQKQYQHEVECAGGYPTSYSHPEAAGTVGSRMGVEIDPHQAVGPEEIPGTRITGDIGFWGALPSLGLYVLLASGRGVYWLIGRGSA
ncbi:hypothetical protein V5P93_002448 [Actinokineospora auranticolor]|uniref:Uncharacterized protein n=1 Tax=Actinokineospora auranticolor TaxID=155976 RepID=A0A2S6GN18_9PSEU|nr:hypothetical protein [Actinokineospora auranticolor]PPK66521.1 hypothetical protein CLV40_110225 [Actinokineospora auranticolor]